MKWSKIDRLLNLHHRQLTLLAVAVVTVTIVTVARMKYIHSMTMHTTWLAKYQQFVSVAWWRHQIETFPALLALCAVNSPVTGEFPAQWPVTQNFDVSLICTWTNGNVNNRYGGGLRRRRAHYDVIVMNVLVLEHVYTFDAGDKIYRLLGPIPCLLMHWPLKLPVH